jgi:hypothetical protein
MILTKGIFCNSVLTGEAYQLRMCGVGLGYEPKVTEGPSFVIFHRKFLFLLGK